MKKKGVTGNTDTKKLGVSVINYLIARGYFRFICKAVYRFWAPENKSSEKVKKTCELTCCLLL